VQCRLSTLFDLKYLRQKAQWNSACVSVSWNSCGYGEKYHVSISNLPICTVLIVRGGPCPFSLATMGVGGGRARSSETFLFFGGIA
jgi:hypothetical protein